MEQPQYELCKDLYNDITEGSYLLTISEFFEDRSRSWIMLLIYNDKINNLYINHYASIAPLLSSCYLQRIMSYHGMHLSELSSYELNIFCTELSKCFCLEKLDLSNNNLGSFTDSQLKQLVFALQQCYNLKSLYLNENLFSPQQMLYIVEYLNIPDIQLDTLNSKELLLFAKSQHSYSYLVQLQVNSEKQSQDMELDKGNMFLDKAEFKLQP